MWEAWTEPNLAILWLYMYKNEHIMLKTYDLKSQDTVYAHVIGATG